MEVGDKLNPQRSYRKGFALKGLHQHIIKTNNPSTIGPDELLTVHFPDLKENQVIIPSTTKFTFNISLAGTDVNKTLEVVKWGFWCKLPLFDHFCGVPTQ